MANEGILIEPIINKKEHGTAIQTEAFSFALKITNIQKAPSNEFNISKIVIFSAESQNISEDFDDKSFFVEKLNPEESKIVEVGKCGSYMHGIVSVRVKVQSSTDPSAPLNLLQKNPFTGEIFSIGKNEWHDFFYIRNSNEYKQERATNWAKFLTAMIAFFTLLQIVSIFYIEPWKLNESIKRKINETDNFNLFVACQVKSIYKTGDNFLLDYETQHYIENFDSVNKQPDSIKQAVRDNIALMQASNEMMNLLFEKPEKRTEFSPKLIKNAEKIIDNLDVYNEQIIEGECAD